MASDGQFLPSSRKVSLAMHFDVDKPHSHLMALTAVWAELISKDISHSPQFAGYNQSALKCCNVTFDTFHAECYPIRIDGDDPYYSKFGDNCQEYVRTSVAPRVGCTLGKHRILMVFLNREMSEFCQHFHRTTRTNQPTNELPGRFLSVRN